MAENTLNILHIDTGREWRGGQRQAALLLGALRDRHIRSALVCQPDSPFYRYCTEHGLACHPVAMRSEFDILAMVRIARLCRKGGYRILQLHTAHAMGVGAGVKLLCPKVRLIGMRRVDFPVRANPFSRFKYRWRGMDRVVCISENIRRVMNGSGVPDRRLRVIRSGIDPDGVRSERTPGELRRELGVPADGMVVGTVAALVGHKDYPNLLRAAAVACGSDPAITFCAIGDGPLMGDMRRMHSELGLGTRFIFTGQRPHAVRFMRAFDVFVLASKKEGLGTSVLDAMAAGIPVIGTDAGGIPEMIRDGENGLLVPAGDPEKLGRAIAGLTTDRERCRHMGERGRGMVGDFTIERAVERYLDLYRELDAEGNA